MGTKNPNDRNTESKIQLDICEYIKDAYPNVVFTSESSGIKLTIGQSMVAKRTRSSRALPDIWVLEPKKGYHGLCIELKKHGEKVYKKNGAVRSNGHLNEQEEIQQVLRHKGYMCEFGVGLEEAKRIIDWYMS